MPEFLEVVARNRAAREAIVRNVKAIPGVEVAATTKEGFPFSGSGMATSFRIDSSLILEAILTVRQVSPNYFDVLGIPILEGRTFTDNEDAVGARRRRGCARGNGPPFRSGRPEPRA